jgi:hypothetical protein
MCVGCTSVADLRAWQADRMLQGNAPVHRTRNMPRRADEVLAGGSLYWIIQGQVRVRQRILALDPGVDGEGTRFCLIRLDPILVETIALPHRPMQGWRYLTAEDAPADRDPGLRDDTDIMPASMVSALRSLGLL